MQGPQLDEVSERVFVQFTDEISVEVETSKVPQSSESVRLEHGQFVIPQHQLAQVRRRTEKSHRKFAKSVSPQMQPRQRVHPGE